MCCWPCVCYVHQTNTTGLDKKERKNFKYAKKCSQCHKTCTETDRVAAHVTAYPCFCLNCCIGFNTLKTTCKSCNSSNKKGKKKINRKSFFVSGSFTPIKVTFFLSCFHKKRS